MKNSDKVFKELFNQTDSITICDVNGKILFYQDYNDQINMMRDEEAIGHTIFELYPFLEREDFTVFKAIDKKQPILNEIQFFEVNGIPKKSLNSAYPLINETGVIGCMVLTIEIGENTQKKRHSRITSKYDFEDIITQDATFLESFERLKMIARSNANVLIYGETGTGKELIAHTIHANSPRRGKPFLIQNCAAIPDNLMESILFGSSKGSFTGAIDKSGLFEVADGGTLYLDEVNSLSLELQGKLLRAIENHSIRRIGENEDRDIDVRILSSTNENLSIMVKEGKFRKDLFYRLNVTNYSIPSLKERRGDIPLLCNHYINLYNHRLNHNVEGVDEEVFSYFKEYLWEGNVRELKNVIEYACTIKTSGKITIHDLPSYMFNQRTIETVVSQEQVLSSKQLAAEAFMKPGTSLKSQLDVLEKEILKMTFIRNRYNISKTSDELKISRQTLYNKLKKYELL